MLITGTHKGLVIRLYSIYKPNCSYYIVQDSIKDYDVRHVQLSPYAASMIQAYSTSKTLEHKKIVLCIQEPKVSLQHKLEQKEFDRLFRTEWFFILDMIRQSLFLLDNEKNRGLRPLLLISLPSQYNKKYIYKHTNKNTNLDMFFTSLHGVIQSISRHFPNVSLFIHTQSNNEDQDVLMIHHILESNTSTLLKKILFHSIPSKRFSQKLFSFFKK